MRLNTQAAVRTQMLTHEGARAHPINALQQLRRSVLAYMLWEDQFYEGGEYVAARVARLVAECAPTDVMALAIKARHEMKLRHVPLLLARAMARLPEHKALVAHTLEQIIDRPDEIREFLAIYWKDKKGLKGEPLSAQVKKGLSAAYNKFNEYGFAKYNGKGEVKFRDGLFLTHAKPADAGGKGRYTRFERAEGVKRKLTQKETLFKKVVENTLETPDTWEVELSAGKDKRETFERLIADNKLGALALLRNLRNMRDAGVDHRVIAGALDSIKVERVLPFRFIAAARAVPEYEDIIEPAMLKCLEGREKLPGRTVLLVDVSGSMDSPISSKSDLSRIDAACGLAILARELCDEVQIWTFSDQLVAVPPRRGFALRDAIDTSQGHCGTYLGGALRVLKRAESDRLIVITDEQSHDRPGHPGCNGYIINVAAYQHGVGYGEWKHIDGWSEAVFDYVRELEDEE